MTPSSSSVCNVSIIAPTCFYYQVPLSRVLAADEEIDLTVYFCTDEGTSGRDAQSTYGTNESWETENELLEGYTYKILRN